MRLFYFEHLEAVLLRKARDNMRGALNSIHAGLVGAMRVRGRAVRIRVLFQFVHDDRVALLPKLLDRLLHAPASFELVAHLVLDHGTLMLFNLSSDFVLFFFLFIFSFGGRFVQ